MPIIDYLKKTFHGSEAAFHTLATKALENEEKLFVVTANPETMMIARNSEAFDKVLLSETTTIVPDGIGVIKGLESLGISTEGRVTGVALAAHLFAEASRLKKKIYLYGAKPEVNDKMAEVIAKEYPDAILVGRKHGYGFNGDEVFDEIVSLQPDVILVALGIPAQELLIHKHLDRLEKGVLVGVGGSFDVLSGTKKRAPKLFVKLNLEWLYRIACEPKRIKRFYQSNVKFFSVLKKERKALKK